MNARQLIQEAYRRLLHEWMQRIGASRRPRVTIQWSHKNGALCRFFREELPKRFAR